MKNIVGPYIIDEILIHCIVISIVTSKVREPWGIEHGALSKVSSTACPIHELRLHVYKRARVEWPAQYGPTAELSMRDSIICSRSLTHPTSNASINYQDS